MPTENTQIPQTLLGVLGTYKGVVAVLVVITIVANAFSLLIPKVIARAIDSYTSAGFSLERLSLELSLIALCIFVATYIQSVVQVLASERVARDMRNNITVKLSEQSYAYVEKVSPAVLLTNLTSDVDAIKTFIATAIASLISSAFLIVGTSVLLLTIDWKLALAVLAVVPVIAGTFFVVLRKVRKLFTQSQEAIDWLNKVIGESIFGAALIRLLHTERVEYEKFLKASTEAKRISLLIVGLFASLVPAITFLTNIATLAIVLLGGHFVIQGGMSLGNFTAFNSYVAILIFPILIIGFMSTLIAQAQASYGRIALVLNAPVEKSVGERVAVLQGDVALEHCTVRYGEKTVLNDVSFSVPAGSKTAIVGPTAAGKTRLLYILTGLLEPTEGRVLFDGVPASVYTKESLHSQVGFVFQDSVMFNLSVRENIAFSSTVSNEALQKAIATAELEDYMQTLPDKLDTLVSERGTSLSGGQKQRMMLARALALNPKVLLLDDFTARVDAQTEQKILHNITKNYPSCTLISVTQKIASIEHYDQIVVLMEGELLAKGTHAELLERSHEYAQMYQSQRSTAQYEKEKPSDL